jgi:hypothetical protein
MGVTDGLRIYLVAMAFWVVDRLGVRGALPGH